MKSYLLQDDHDVQFMRDLIRRQPHKPTVVDFEESILLETVRATTRLWKLGDKIVGFAYLDDYHNLRFETDPGYPLAQLENEIINWGSTCMRDRNAKTGEKHSMDSSCDANHVQRIALLEKHGFVRDPQFTLHYTHSLTDPLTVHPLPSGFAIRCVEGEEEVDDLARLHQAAFGTKNMTVEQRLAIMHTPGYTRALDLVVTTPDGDLAAFCICGLEEAAPGRLIGTTDPIGTHPNYRRRGLGKAIVTAGMQALKARGAAVAALGTSSDNLPMQRLAETLGFICESRTIWFSKEISSA